MTERIHQIVAKKNLSSWISLNRLKSVSNIPPWPLHQLVPQMPDFLWWWTVIWKDKPKKTFSPKLPWSWCSITGKMSPYSKVNINKHINKLLSSYLVWRLGVNKNTTLSPLKWLLDLFQFNGQMSLKILAQSHAGMFSCLATSKYFIITQKCTLVFQI